MEVNSRRVLYGENMHEKLPMASTTKILTAITVLENCDDLTTRFPVPEKAVGVEGSSVYLKVGDELSTEDLLYGLMLRSGNDCAEALAYHLCGNIPDFCAKMNETAERAGAVESHFLTPHGLPKAGHYTTARDLSLIASYAMQNEEFSKIVSTRFYEPCGWANKNKMLYRYDGAIGVKTGFTKQAGRCLVSAMERNGMTLVCTVLCCPQMYERSEKLLSDAFSRYENVQIVGKDAPVEVPTAKKPIAASTKENLSYPLLLEERGLIEKRIIPKNGLSGREKTGEKVGKIEIYLANRLLFSENLYKL